jgi:hypothetical protein
MRITVTLTAFFLLTACTSDAKEVGLLSESDTKTLCSSAADTFGKGNIQGAFDALAIHWPLPKEDIDAIAIQSKSQMNLVGARYGGYVGVEFIRTTKAGESFFRHLYAIKYDNHAVRFSCSFYRPRDKWIVNGFNWDDQPVVPNS